MPLFVLLALACSRAPSVPFAALHQFSNRGSTFAPGPPAPAPQGVVLSSPEEQPVLERHRGESRPYCEGDQASRGEGAEKKNTCENSPRCCFWVSWSSCRLCCGAANRMPWPLSLVLGNRSTPNYERGCELAQAPLPLLSCVSKLYVCFSTCERVCLHPCDGLHAVSCCLFWTGDLRADWGREATHRWPQSGQEGASTPITTAIIF